MARRPARTDGPDEPTARVATCPGERGTVSRAAPRTIGWVPEGDAPRRIVVPYVHRNRPPFGGRCRSRGCQIPATHEHRSFRTGAVTALLVPTLPSGCAAKATEAALVPGWVGACHPDEWSVIGTSRGAMLSGEVRLQGLTPFGKPRPRVGDWPTRGPMLSWASASSGVSPPVSGGRFPVPSPRELPSMAPEGASQLCSAGS